MRPHILYVVTVTEDCTTANSEVTVDSDQKGCERKQLRTNLTLILPTWRIWWSSNNASKWQRGFNLAFKGLRRYPESCLEWLRNTATKPQEVTIVA